MDARRSVAATANAGLRFLLEVTTLLVMALWGYEMGTSTATRYALAIACPLVVAAIWGAFAAPKAQYRLADPWRFLLEMAVFGAAALALVELGWLSLGIVFAFLAVASAVLFRALGAGAFE